VPGWLAAALPVVGPLAVVAGGVAAFVRWGRGWLGHRPIAVASEWGAGKRDFGPSPFEAVPESKEEARMVVLHMFNHDDHPREMIVRGQSKVRGVDGSLVVPRRVNLEPHSGKNVVLTVIAPSSNWPTPEPLTRPFVLRGRTELQERVRWRGKVTVYPYQWDGPVPLVAWLGRA
jgi:hypothetical protein